MHDAYRALISEDAQARAIAANQLLKYVPIYSAKTFEKAFVEGSLELETARLEKVLVDAFFLARDTLSGRKIQSAIDALHDRNADWLSGTIARTACFNQISGTLSPLSGGKPSSLSKRNSPADSSSLDSSRHSAIDGPAAQAGLSVLVLILIGGLGYAIYHSRPLKIKRVERLPRFPVAFKATASFDEDQRNIIVLDMSLGGAKIECDHPPTEKEPITLYLQCGAVPASIVWATAFYAGVMFDEQLSEDDLQSVLNDKAVTTRSRLSNVF